jgi:hypothetical protein
MPNRALIRELTIVDTENKDYNSECDCVKKKKNCECDDHNYYKVITRRKKEKEK